MRFFIISDLKELKEIVKWKYLFLNSCKLRFQIDSISLVEAREWESLFNKAFKPNGNFESLIMAMFSSGVFVISLLIAQVKVFDMEIKLLGILVISIGAILGKLLGLILTRMCLRYLVELLSEEINLRNIEESFSEKEMPINLFELSQTY